MVGFCFKRHFCGTHWAVEMAFWNGSQMVLKWLWLWLFVFFSMVAVCVFFLGGCCPNCVSIFPPELLKWCEDSVDYSNKSYDFCNPWGLVSRLAPPKKIPNNLSNLLWKARLITAWQRPCASGLQARINRSTALAIITLDLLKKPLMNKYLFPNSLLVRPKI